MKIQFRRIPWSKEQVLPGWAQKFFDGATEEERKYFDVGIVHELSPLEDGEVVEWAWKMARLSSGQRLNRL